MITEEILLEKDSMVGMFLKWDENPKSHIDEFVLLLVSNKKLLEL